MTMMTMPIASRFGVPVFRKKSEKVSIVSIKESITHRSEEESATKISLKLYQKRLALSIGRHVPLKPHSLEWGQGAPYQRKEPFREAPRFLPVGRCGELHTTSCAHEVNLWCSNFLEKSLRVSARTLILRLFMQSQCVRRLVHNFCGKNVENVFESNLQRASLRDG